MPDPNLRYGLKQITSNSWFKSKSPAAHTVGTRVGVDIEPLHSNVLLEMEKDACNKVEINYVKRCL